MLKLHNTLTGKTEEFEPLEKGKVRFYSCGPTVYDYFHIGNARPFIVFDGLRRYLEFKGYEVEFTQNVTDLDDKIINRAEEEGIEPNALARKYADAYFEDLNRLGVREADNKSRVTEYIPDIIEHVEALVEKGYGYEVDGDVYFRVKEFDEYGKLSGRSVDDLKSGSRVEVDERKEDPLDFALWKSSDPEEPGWDSPWGRGRPGWHIECSVMAQQTLGETIDIHAGGQDLIFPHHENEIAQSEARTGEQFSRYWVHNGLLRYEGDKMSKSLGNFEYARNVLDDFGKETVRYFYFSTHYRKPINFSEKNLTDAESAVKKVYEFFNTVDEIEAQETDGQTPNTEEGKEFSQFIESAESRFVEEVDKDFNTPGGLGVIFDLVNEGNKFREKSSGEDLFLLKNAKDTIRKLASPLGLFQGGGEDTLRGLEEEFLELLLNVRNELRDDQHWELADRIRSELKEIGVVIKDREEGTRWKIDTDKL
ncbi:cysteine--tRNA ligase [Candidatus Bipolaricaulota bacterium]|nr:cysteine--tRNA ligase [Candidatus Bipolaricaulota bacterium]